MSVVGSALKRATKSVLQRVLRTDYPAVIVASMGRSGSTLVHTAVSEGMAAARFGSSPLGRRIVFDVAWDLRGKTFMPGVVYKTHALGDELDKHEGVKVIFVFGAASDSAISVVACREKFGDAWISEHFGHLRADGEFQDLFSKDVMRFEEQIDSWVNCTGAPRIIVHYDELWARQEDISEFLGFPIVLPERRARESSHSVGRADVERIREGYSSLDDKIRKIEKFQRLD